ncbi:peptidoglycan-binding domain-containing protein [Krasilnikoviella flava]|uniref:Peptidoglycan-binding (PGRP) domain of peptidoglycan hydrolases-containing protein n=1 Tax=Krasilnikoviella flava TaxID=526729 RepID=A0A1T5KQ11_9MICO|nr:peptidoglycan-binding protein [Krasilnikoviella flava]SKC65846.1 Peptidoglycan-binding (PGRP) domain of peptidoglycan hydrolases-containing protein [Krasilnikoviella flava]
MSVTTSKALDPWPVVRPGDRFHPVGTLQHLLNEHGHDLEADASFGPLTEAAVRASQRDFGLEADGVVGPRTWGAIVVTVRNGSRGHAVRGAQSELDTRIGFDLVVDGVFGARTEAAARELQKALSAFGVLVDGVVGPVTWRAMVSGMVSH